MASHNMERKTEMRTKAPVDPTVAGIAKSSPDGWARMRNPSHAARGLCAACGALGVRGENPPAGPAAKRWGGELSRKRQAGNSGKQLQMRVTTERRISQPSRSSAVPVCGRRKRRTSTAMSVSAHRSWYSMMVDGRGRTPVAAA